MCDLQHSKQLIVLSPNFSGININGNISANTVFIIRRI